MVRMGAHDSLPPRDARLLEARQGSLRALAAAFKSGVEQDRLPAPQAMREDALSGMWNFSATRERIPEQVAELCVYFRTKRPGLEDHGMNLRIMRISLALYLLDKTGELSQKFVAADNRGTKITALFTTARKAVERLLDERYFSKSQDEILTGYLEAEPALASIASVLGAQLPCLMDAVAEYKNRVADMAEAHEAAAAGACSA